jgi:septum formation protein
MKIILGSQSKEIGKILEEIGIKFEFMPAELAAMDKKITDIKDPKDLALAIAKAKADALESRISEPAILITSGQVVVCNGKIMGVPKDKGQARNFLQKYSIYPIEIMTAVITTNFAANRTAKKVDVAKICFSPFSEEEISDIVNEREVFQRIGGFSIWDEKWAQHINCIEGTFDSILGLPKGITQMLIITVI